MDTIRRLPCVACRSPPRSSCARSGVVGLESSRNPFQTHPSDPRDRAAAAHRAARAPTEAAYGRRSRASTATATDDRLSPADYDQTYLLGNPPDYDQPPEICAGERRCARAGNRKSSPTTRCDGRWRGMPTCRSSIMPTASTPCMRRRAIPAQCRAVPRRRAWWHHLRRQPPNLPPDELDARPQSRRKTVDPVRGGGAVAEDRALGRPRRPRRDRPWLQGRRQRDRLRLAAPASAKVHHDLPSAAAADAAGRRRRGHHRAQAW